MNPVMVIVPPIVPPIAPPLAMMALWIYVTLLVAGGLVGFVKAGSKISLLPPLRSRCCWPFAPPA